MDNYPTPAGPTPVERLLPDCVVFTLSLDNVRCELARTVEGAWLVLTAPTVCQHEVRVPLDAARWAALTHWTDLLESLAAANALEEHPERRLADL